MHQCGGCTRLLHHQVVADCEQDGSGGPSRVGGCVVIED